MLELLSPDITLWTDGGGKVRQALRPVMGAATVAAWSAAIGAVTYQGVEPADRKAELVAMVIPAIASGAVTGPFTRAG